MATLILRGCKADGTSKNGFKWPMEVGATATAPDWTTTAECGGGLHGFLHGEGDSSASEYFGPDCKWMAVEPVGDVIDLGGKVKFQSGVVRFGGSLQEAANYVLANDPDAKGKKVIGGTATAGNYGTATAGNYGTATAGDEGTATAGDEGTATAGNYGTATAGYMGTATAGNYGTATAGNYGTATAGDEGTATAGNYGTATAGNKGTATAGYYGTATAGDGGAIIIGWHDKDGRWRIKVGEVGKDCDLKPGQAYQLDKEGNFVAVDTKKPGV